MKHRNFAYLFLVLFMLVSSQSDHPTAAQANDLLTFPPVPHRSPGQLTFGKCPYQNCNSCTPANPANGTLYHYRYVSARSDNYLDPPIIINQTSGTSPIFWDFEGLTSTEGSYVRICIQEGPCFVEYFESPGWPNDVPPQPNPPARLGYFDPETFHPYVLEFKATGVDYYWGFPNDQKEALVWWYEGCPTSPPTADKDLSGPNIDLTSGKAWVNLTFRDNETGLYKVEVIWESSTNLGTPDLNFVAAEKVVPIKFEEAQTGKGGFRIAVKVFNMLEPRFDLETNTDMRSSDIITKDVDMVANNDPTRNTFKPYGQIVKFETNDAGQRYFELIAQDTGSGLLEIDGSMSENIALSIPAFTSGTTSPVTVIVTVIDPAQPVNIRLTIKDVIGNTNQFWPEIDYTTIGNGDTQTLTGITDDADSIVVTNGNPGLQSVFATVNSTPFLVDNLSPGEVRNLEIQSALKSGGQNEIELVGVGQPGTSANVLIWGKTEVSSVYMPHLFR